MDPFATLGIERRFDVDLRAIERTHRDLSRATHPDRHGSSPPSSRAEALGKSVEINEAMRIVRDPLRRAEALFTLAGIPVGETTEPQPSQEFLSDMLERREALEQAKDAKDLKRITSLTRAIEERAAFAERALSDGFRDAKGDQSKLKKNVHLLGELRFFRRFLEEVSAIEDALNGLS